MNPQLETAITGFVNKANQGVDVAYENVPMVIHQFVVWQSLQYWCGLAIISLLILYLVRKTSKLIGEFQGMTPEAQNESVHPYAVRLLQVVIAGLTLTNLYYVVTLIQIHFFTEMYIVKEAMNWIS